MASRILRHKIVSNPAVENGNCERFIPTINHKIMGSVEAGSCLTIGIDTAQEIFVQAHIVEAIVRLLPLSKEVIAAALAHTASASAMRKQAQTWIPDLLVGDLLRNAFLIPALLNQSESAM